MPGYSLSDPTRREALERRIRDGIHARRLGTALGGHTLRFPAGSTSGVVWDQAIEDELARLQPEAALRLLHCVWSPAGWAISCIYEPGCVLVWQARFKPDMPLGDYLTAIDPLDLHEQIGLYPKRRVSVEL